VKLAVTLLFSSLGVFAGALLTAQGRIPYDSTFPRLSRISPAAADLRKIELGRDLFSDRRLSRSNDMSCASCHDLATNGATANSHDADDFGHPISFNTPTVFNSALGFRMGWEAQVRTVEIMSLGALRKILWGSGIAEQRLTSDPKMSERFEKIYGGPATDESIANALGAFVRTLVTTNAPFDRWLAGDRGALTAQQVRGYNRFRELGCSSCHQGRNIGSNIIQHADVYHWLSTSSLKYVRVPSLRNVAATAPYFDDGSCPNLPQAIRRMGRSQLDIQIGNRDVDDIAAFLNSLTGTYQGHLVSPPVSATK
jgi:cytochrome c peroxidase